MTATGMQAAGFIEAVGPDAGGFAPGDRVAYPAAAANKGLNPVLSERDLIGFPKDVPIEKAVGFLPLGLVARTVVKQLHSVGRANTVSVAHDHGGAHAFVEAWVANLGATIVDENETADVVITPADYAAARAWRPSHGTGQQNASEVFQAIRAGVFDDIPLSTFPLEEAARARAELDAGPVVLLPATEWERAA